MAKLWVWNFKHVHFQMSWCWSDIIDLSGFVLLIPSIIVCMCFAIFLLYAEVLKAKKVDNAGKIVTQREIFISIGEFHTNYFWDQSNCKILASKGMRFLQLKIAKSWKLWKQETQGPAFGIEFEINFVWCLLVVVTVKSTIIPKDWPE